MAVDIVDFVIRAGSLGRRLIACENEDIKSSTNMLILYNTESREIRQRVIEDMNLLFS